MSEKYLLKKEAYIELSPDFKICRVLNGMWQVSGSYGRINPTLAVSDMDNYLNAGFITWDLADHYGPAEDFVKIFREKSIQGVKRKS